MGTTLSCSNPERTNTETKPLPGNEVEDVAPVKKEAKIRVLNADDGKYKLGQVLGDGASCKVVVGHDSEGKGEYAIKVMELNDDMKPLFEHEVKILGQLSHPNVLDFVDAYQTPDNYHLVTTLMKGKELFDRVANGAFTERIASQRTKDMLEALCHCHALNVVHRDLKPENFVFESPDEESRMQLIDFGCALHVADDEVVDTVCGSPYYMAPELLKRHFRRTGKTWKAADMWSIGVIVYMFMHGYPPFNGASMREIYLRIKKGKYRFSQSKHLSDNVKDFIKRLLVMDPTKRMSAQEALNHPWITDLDSHSHEPLPQELKDSLRDFQHSNRLRKAVGRLLIKKMVPKDEKILSDAFKQFDTNGDGHLELDELRAFMKHIGQDPTDAATFLETYDTDHDGTIDLEELKVAHQSAHITEEQAKEIFLKADTDHSGYLDEYEVKKILGVADDELHELMEEVDQNHDGKIQLGEWMEVITKAHSRRQNRRGHKH